VGYIEVKNFVILAVSLKNTIAMTTLTLLLEDKQVLELERKAKLLNMSLEAFLAETIKNILVAPTTDFDTAMKYVLNKNEELFKRLA
jgi:hypothetical protein